MAMVIPCSLVFKVERSEPELIPPAKPTPYEFKLLSDIDDQKGLRCQTAGISFYRHSPEMQGRDPVKVLKDAIAETLVYYYPFAGRLREGPDDKLMVECTGEGVLFIEANANVTLDQFDEVLLQPPFLGTKDLLYNVPGSDGILHCPLWLIQVTRLMCGGFIFASRMNHTMCDGIGQTQFMTAVGEMARGAPAPSVQPVWRRELLNARDPPRVSCVHHVFDELPADTEGMVQNDGAQLIHRSFFFTLQDIKGLKNHVPPHLRKCSKFDILAATIWRCHTFALNLTSDCEIRAAINVNTRGMFSAPLPVGYYGNAIVLPVAQSTTGKLCQNPLGYALELVKRAKAGVSEEFMRSTADLMVKTGRPRYKTVKTLCVSDLTGARFENVDIGWGTAVYSGPIAAWPTGVFFLSSKNSRGEDGILVVVNFPGAVMERFATEIEKMIKGPNNIESTTTISPLRSRA